MGCEAAKLRLSANVEATINIECIMDDTDVSGKINRDEFETLSAPLVAKLMTIIQKIRDQSGNPQVDTLELMGGASRIPAIEHLMRENFPKPEGVEEDIIARSLILQDPVARGCALAAAQISPMFKLFEFTVQDVVVHPVAFSWLHLGGQATDDNAEEDAAMNVDDESAGVEVEKTMTLFDKGTPNPSSKLVTFQRKETFELNSSYVCPDDLTPGSSPFVGKFSVSGIPDNKMAKIKVKIRMDPSSLITVESAEMVETEYIEVEEPIVPEAAPAPAEAEEAAPAEGEAADAEEAAPADAEMEAPPADAEEAAPAAAEEEE